MLLRSLFGLVACLLAFDSQAVARTDPSVMCDTAAQRIAGESKVPLDVLRAITRTETGRARGGTLRPWPWTVNMEGKGVWFENENEARAYVFRHFERGARSFDVGCFQINYRWHGQAFDSIEEMFDPLINARYAAKFLSELFAEYGDWTAAAGAYHSRTGKFADRYIARYSEIRRSLESGSPQTDALPSENTRINSFALLARNGNSGTRGSLVPLVSNGRSLFAPRKGG